MNLISRYVLQRELWLVVLLFLAAAGIRIGHLDDSRFMSERQYRSAMIARADYLAKENSVPDWRKHVAAVSAHRLGVLEPPVMEFLSVQAYRVLGYEQIWIPRMLATLFWLIGGGCLFLLASHLVSRRAAVYAIAFYLFFPLGIAVSIAFIPDSLMLMLFIAGLLAIVLYAEQPSPQRLIAAGVLSGLCVLVKPLCIFGLTFAFVALRIKSSGIRSLVKPASFLMGAFILFPALTYYVYGMYIHGFMYGQAEASFVPGLLLQASYWKKLLSVAANSIGTTPISLALLGLLIPVNKHFRPLIVGLISGYVLFCLLFTYHVRVSGHYHLQLIVPVALGIGAAVDFFVKRIRTAVEPRWLFQLTVLCAAVIIGVAAVQDALSSIRAQGDIVSPAVATKVGEAVEHSTRVVYVSQYYGAPLEYFGELSGWYWPRGMTNIDRALGKNQSDTHRSVEERLKSLGTAQSKAEADFVPEYFAVTDFREYAFHADLAEYLDTHCSLIVSQPTHLVYGKCND